MKNDVAEDLKVEIQYVENVAQMPHFQYEERVLKHANYTNDSAEFKANDISRKSKIDSEIDLPNCSAPGGPNKTTPNFQKG